MNNSVSDFYKAFEDRYRGSKEQIKLRLSVYLPFIYQLKKIDPNLLCLDLGCGRGEWLELLMENHIEAYGIDLNEQMIHKPVQDGYRVILGDAITHLKTLPNASLSLITGFHIAEHLHFNDLFKLVEESLRVLKPAGLLILETPNSENILVGSSGFYTDPTHLRPLPILLLSFLTMHIGFVRNTTLRLQEWKDLHKDLTPVSLYQVLSGVSPDYSIIAQKDDTQAQLDFFNALFQTEYGISLEKLSLKFTIQHDQYFKETNKKLAELEEFANLSLQKLYSVEAYILSKKATIERVEKILNPINKVYMFLKNIFFRSP
jgi:SAM-dependent methyltransferase